MLEGQMKNKVYMWICVVCSTLSIYPAVVGGMPQLGKPGALYIDNQKVFVVDQTSVHIYSLSGMRHIKTFGTKGEGPGEFKHPPLLSFYMDSILANSTGALTLFSTNGELIWSRKIPFNYNYFSLPLVSLGKNFVGMIVKGRGSAVIVFDNAFNPVKEIYSGIVQLPPPPVGASGGNLKINVNAIDDCFDYQIHDDKLFIGDTAKGFYFSVFDRRGNHLYDIKKNESKLEVTSIYRDAYMTNKQRSKIWHQEKIKYNYVFPKYFPAYFSFQIRDGKIYASTYKEKNGNYEIVVLDLKGNELKRAFAHPLQPFERMSEIGSYKNQYAIYDNKIYYIVDNEQTETWELHCQTI